MPVRAAELKTKEDDPPDWQGSLYALAVYDVTGAVDTTLATLAVALAAGAALGDAVWLANLAAGLAVGEAGTAAISRVRLIEAMASLRRGKSAATTDE